MAREANRTIRFLKRIGTLALGLSANGFIVYWYDFTVYPQLILEYGLARGWAYAAVGSIGLCLATLWFYNLTKVDWLFIETIKKVRDTKAHGAVWTFFHNLSNRGDWLAFLWLSFAKDGFLTVVYMRKGAGNYAMSSRDWKIFWSSAALSEIFWGLSVFGVLETFQTWLRPLIPTGMLEQLYAVAGAIQAGNAWLAHLLRLPLRLIGL